jgi:hypothetical protein
MSVLHSIRHAIKLMEELVLVPFLALLDQVISFNELVLHLFYFCLEVPSLRSRVLVKNHCKVMSQRSMSAQQARRRYVHMFH